MNSPPILFFIVPAYRRHELTRLCLEQLRWTCDKLNRHGRLHANAAVIADEPEILGPAKELGFWTIDRENDPLGRKFNDGFEAAHIAGADYVVPCGSDNWVHPNWFTQLPAADEVICHRLCAIVRPDGQELAELEISYDGGDGIRIFPMELFAPLGYRPAADYRNRAIDTSIVERLRRFAGWTPKWVYHEWSPLKIIGFQSEDVQLNGYEDLARSFGKRVDPMPWHRLAEVYPPDSVARMEQFFAARTARKVVAA